MGFSLWYFEWKTNTGQSEIYFVSFVKAVYWRPYFDANHESIALDRKTS